MDQSKDRYEREEVVRLICQSLHDLGYSRSTQLLEMESGFSMERPEVTQFRKGVLAGDWSHVEALLPSIGLQEPEKLEKVQFLLRRQKYLELLEAREVPAALGVLRNELTPLGCDTEQLHLLSSLLMCGDVKDLKKLAGWNGTVADTRKKLLEELQVNIAPSVMIPNRRMETLFDQAAKYQRDHCLYHDITEKEFSLYSDHRCDQSRFPGVTKHVFEGHSDEVWYVAFSNNGKYIASGSKDGTAIIWSIEEKRKLHVLKVLGKEVCFLAWSPNDSMIVTCANDGGLSLWNTRNGTCIRTLDNHTDVVTSCAWLSNNVHFVSGGLDKSLYLWNIQGSILYQWSNARVTDIAVSKDGKKMVSICADCKIRIYDLEKRLEQDYIKEDRRINSMRLSDDGRYVVVNLNDQDIHLWDIVEKRLVRRFAGLKQCEFIIRSCFGGHDQAFIASGSADGSIYVWHREQGTLIKVLPGHVGPVNCIHWNPANPYMFVSASDDRTIRL
ncbi:WD40 repeat-like protein [Basidiobolus meristosporus CBS 931.73]|uniref:WD40 repeat-like protein n=1 Tax=Basidiobolus meristosporus CBS 931.73 TaxID=1314790 RepID=A0A1Y1XTS9_9FUNG|nr:WD40 repeat-like protein [Basidiobolus meristosporus CBS 931.73]|eukprot:ORX89150.1 WD40 repeat-like protein [Basidiobolus meristosporus CBS 931.73]